MRERRGKEVVAAGHYIQSSGEGRSGAELQTAPVSFCWLIGALEPKTVVVRLGLWPTIEKASLCFIFFIF